LLTTWPRSYDQIPYFWNHEIFSFGKRLRVHSKYAFTFSLLSIELLKMFLKCFTHNINTFLGRTSTPRTMKFTILVKRYSSFQISIYFQFAINELKIFEKYFTPTHYKYVLGQNLNSEHHEIYNFGKTLLLIKIWY
jgi:hypothetical protein